jgi:hypothetical protein
MYHLELDAKTFADWEIDYVKMDGCNSEAESMEYTFYFKKITKLKT